MLSHNASLSLRVFEMVTAMMLLMFLALPCDAADACPLFPIHWHFGLENGHGRSVEVELGGNSYLLSGWLISQILPVLVRLDGHVLSADDWLWRWNVSVGVDGHHSLSLTKIIITHG